jgi:hypothetical protein
MLNITCFVLSYTYFSLHLLNILIVLFSMSSLRIFYIVGFSSFIYKYVCALSVIGPQAVESARG